MAEICNNREIYGKIAASSIKSERGFPIGNICIVFAYHLHIG